ncbi:hypothetical protein POVWA2_041360 [Plasmodium ovale wallikeri]|uniref:Uncharacterized protein n=1 Tax=Plasmodium ovale wallikeri TaxID=864142 RepID=A0A1A8ZB58_PLAOA|nr:hypothetical protein POVWA2_041360 [Plasmodium ovale wallikeri]
MYLVSSRSREAATTLGGALPRGEFFGAIFLTEGERKETSICVCVCTKLPQRGGEGVNETSNLPALHKQNGTNE